LFFSYLCYSFVFCSEQQFVNSEKRRNSNSFEIFWIRCLDSCKCCLICLKLDNMFNDHAIKTKR
jgi:hypothetical protein